ncbi:ABC transporter permease [Dactylosporangium siamense]|uniref:Peptide ABC transporter permease n=1 Tax=Dactylosporangium siamense TaxID=685454 RepID=A0A919PD70_9ACTN|nr:ABC transporter permease [Dactylosporangium siamense]GIG42615.1 peptide ABC transporter permease [Dactylosporangium siamense]
MTRYVAQRAVRALFVLWAAFTVSFAMLYLLPGDPVSVMLGGSAGTYTPAQIDDLRSQYGLDRSVPGQYVTQLWHALHGDFGTSIRTGAPVAPMLAQALPQTALLALTAFVLAVVGGLGIALAATSSRRPAVRQVLLSLPGIGTSVPTFWVGLLLVDFVSFRWRLLPALGNDGWQSLVLPAVTLALPCGSVLAQVFAKSLRDTLREPYLDTARAKGAGRARVHLRHAARNAALPAVTLSGIIVGNLLAGAVVVETVFSREGVGRITAEAVLGQDIPVVQGAVVLGAVGFVLVNLAVDAAYPVLDPRITTGRPVPRKEADPRWSI